MSVAIITDCRHGEKINTLNRFLVHVHYIVNAFYGLGYNYSGLTMVFTCVENAWFETQQESIHSGLITVHVDYIGSRVCGLGHTQ